MTRARDEESEPVVRSRGDFAPSAVVRENLYLMQSLEQQWLQKLFPLK